jgi:hypothetical protein
MHPSAMSLRLKAGSEWALLALSFVMTSGKFWHSSLESFYFLGMKKNH